MHGVGALLVSVRTLVSALDYPINTAVPGAVLVALVLAVLLVRVVRLAIRLAVMLLILALAWHWGIIPVSL